jgi:hypothetical protein
MTMPDSAGWYDDPHDPSAQRYWDGTDWSPYRQRKTTPRSSPPPVAAQPPSYEATAQPPVAPADPFVGAQGAGYAATAPPPAMPAQPQAYVTGTQPPDSNLVWAVLSTFLCCFPFGIVAIINATKVSNLWALGQYDAAKAAADSAKKWAIYAAGAAAVAWGAWFVFFVVLPMFWIGSSAL